MDLLDLQQVVPELGQIADKLATTITTTTTANVDRVVSEVAELRKAVVRLSAMIETLVNKLHVDISFNAE